MQEMMFLFAEEWHWSKADMREFTGGELLYLIKTLNRKRKKEADVKRKALEKFNIRNKRKK